MPPIKVRGLEQEHGDLSRVIPALVNELGQWEAGRRLGVSSATISRWLRRNQYQQVTQWMTLEEARRELAALRDLLAHGPDGGAGADMLAIADRADVLTALVKRLEAAELEESA
jgi:hypothetical protein